MKHISLIFLLALTFTSCKKWLDVAPESEISRDVLFQTQEGFQEALNGIYTRSVEGDLYGNELSFGFLEALAQNYSVNSRNNPYDYYQASLFNYKDEHIISKKDNVWKGLYNGIVNANLILEAIDGQKSVFTGNNYSVIKGEALALRAYLHFDLFRIFGSNQASMATGIPYVTTYSNKVTVMSSPAEVINKTLADLEAAKELLKETDSIRSAGYLVNYPAAHPDSVSEADAPNLFQHNRRHRLNYYAVCGQLARVYLYKNDKVNALLNAEEVINSNKFKWTKEADFINIDVKLIDRIMYNELVFGWYIPERLGDLNQRFNSGAASIVIDREVARSMYEASGVGAEDLRFKHWFLQTSADFLEILKYRRNPNARENDLTADRHPLMAPAIRLSEMYYIAGEASYETNPTKATGYLNTVRRARGIGFDITPPSYEAYMNELLKEARKEWYAEGQIFHMYKRLNRSIPTQQGTTIPASKSIYVLPLPNDEIEFGGR